MMNYIQPTKEIRSFVEHISIDTNINSFYSLDEPEQDTFTALCMRAIGNDFDLVLGADANVYLSKLLLTYDRDAEIELIKEVKETAKSQFADYFDVMIKDERRALND